MLQIAPIFDSSNLTAHLLARRLYAPSLSASAEALRRGKLIGLAYSTDALVAPPAMHANAMPNLKLRPSIQPAQWPYQPAGYQTPPAVAYEPHAIPSGEPKNPYDPQKAYGPTADENSIFLDVYA